MRDGAPVRPGDTIGILGGGQLGRMLAVAAAGLGLKSHVFSPDPESPAFDVAATHTLADYADEEALARFSDSVSLVTYEFENVPRLTAEFLEARGTLRPGAAALATAQDRLVEKRFLAGAGIATAAFEDVGSEADLARALAAFGHAGILKTRRFGYDGKGQVRIAPGDRPSEAYASLGGAPAILEALVPFAREVSIIAARATDGAVAAFEPCLNEHRDGILAETRLPAGLAPETEAEAVAIAARILDALGYVGVIAVELFVLDDGRLVVNEIAPRVHNSGHWTVEGAATSQFAQHVRAICGWPLGATTRLGRIRMRNLIGDDIAAWPEILAEPGVRPTHYGKSVARPGRKMGHVTAVTPE